MCKYKNEFPLQLEYNVKAQIKLIILNSVLAIPTFP